MRGVGGGGWGGVGGGGGTADAEFCVPCAENPEVSYVISNEPRVNQNLALYA